MKTPSGRYYNFADCGDKRNDGGDLPLAWFASKTRNKAFFEKKRLLKPTQELGELSLISVPALDWMFSTDLEMDAEDSILSRISGAALVWMSQYVEKEGVKVLQNWKGDGDNPIVIFTGGENDPGGYYFGGKGGRGNTSHRNIDAGSFIFELNGLR